MAAMDEKKEQEILEQFRLRVSDLGRDDATLRRFLRARDHNLNNAEDMLRKSMKWREENDMDNYRKWTFKALDTVKEAFPFDCYGRDNEKRMVYYFGVGAWEVRKMITEGHSEDMLKLMLYSMEDIITDKIDKSGCEHFSLIIDLEFLTYWKVAHYETMQMVLKVFRDFEANYPERLGEAFVINSGWILDYLVLPLVKPLLNGRTLSKVRFLGSDSSKFIPQLLERMSPEALSPKLNTILKTMRNNNAYA